MDDDIILKILQQEARKINYGLEKLVTEKMAFALFVAEHYRFILTAIDENRLSTKSKEEIIDIWKSVKENNKEFQFFNRARELLKISNMKGKEDGNN